MKKRILLFSAAAVILLWWAGVFIADAAVRRASNEPWPLGLGTLDDVPKRLPPRATSDQADALAEAASSFGITLEGRNPPAPQLRRALFGYIDPQFAHPNGQIDPPPQAVAAFLDAQSKPLEAIRRNLIDNPDAIVWDERPDLLRAAPLPNLYGHMVLARALAADAFVRQRAGDPVAWDDVHAMLNLSRPLARRPEMISSLIALSIARMANNVARRLSPPQPAWAREIAAADLRRSFIAAQQAEVWRMSREAEALDPGAPYTRFCLANVIQLHRAAAIDLAAGRTAVTNVPRWNYLGRISMIDFRSVSRRLDRFDQERR